MEPVLADASFWQLSAGIGDGSDRGRPALTGDTDADVCIVGAGYTGLWTARALLDLDPALRVTVVEAQHAGYGASGRNGGWLSGLMPGSRRRMAGGGAGPGGVVAFQRALIDSVAEVGRVVAGEGIECDFHQGGTLSVAATESQMRRLVAGAEEDRVWGWSLPEEVRVLGPEETAARVRIGGRTGAVGSVYRSACARLHPGKLVGGLAESVERRGARIHEHSAVQEVVAARRGARVACAGGTVKADWVVLATEGYSASLPGRRRRLLPMNSSMIVTSPLPPHTWAAIGWQGRETISDGAHTYVYLQRTADDRIAIGGRGVPYRYGSRAAWAATAGRALPTDPATVAHLEAALLRLFPQVDPSRLRAERSWSGVLGVARDWAPFVQIERSPGGGGLLAAGGYAGDGVTTSYLAGRTLADLVLGRDTPLTALPWVDHRARSWEPEPLRWLGVRTVYGLYRAADRAEARHPDRSRTSIWADVAGRIAGVH